MIISITALEKSENFDELLCHTQNFSSSIWLSLGQYGQKADVAVYGLGWSSMVKKADDF